MEPISTTAGAIKWAPIAINAVGSALSALGGASAAKQSAKESKAQRQASERLSYAGMGQNDRQFGFNANMGRATTLDNRALGAAELQGRINRAPLADQAQYLIQQRLGLGSAVGGMGSAAAGYRPGMGGVDTSFLTSARNRLANEALVPGEYQAQSGEQEQLGAMRAQLLTQLNAERRPFARQQLQQRIAEIDAMLGSLSRGGAGSDAVDPNEYFRARLNIPGMR